MISALSPSLLLFIQMMIHLWWVSLQRSLLVSTHVVFCDALPHSSYQNLAGRICVQNSSSAPTQVFQECWSWPPPPLKMQIWTDPGTWGLSWSGPPPPPPMPSPENADLDRSWHFGFELVWTTSGNWCVETNGCIPQGYRLVVPVRLNTARSHVHKTNNCNSWVNYCTPQSSLWRS